jgi:mannose-6-phosphate isomerase-like protein (cupin superfamily)
MKGYVADIEGLTADNQDFRRVLYTGVNLQLVVMCLRKGEEIGLETHHDRDQFFRIEAGMGEVWIDGRKTPIEADIVPAGAAHNIVNTGDAPLHLYTLYAPPEHREGVRHPHRADALADHEHFDGRTTEAPI